MGTGSIRGASMSWLGDDLDGKVLVRMTLIRNSSRQTQSQHAQRVDGQIPMVHCAWAVLHLPTTLKPEGAQRQMLGMYDFSFLQVRSICFGLSLVLARGSCIQTRA